MYALGKAIQESNTMRSQRTCNGFRYEKDYSLNILIIQYLYNLIFRNYGTLWNW